MKSLHVGIVSLLALWPAGVPRSRRASTKAFTGARVIDGTDARAGRQRHHPRARRTHRRRRPRRVTIPAGAERVSLCRQDRHPRPGQRARPRRQHRRPRAGTLLRRERAEGLCRPTPPTASRPSSRSVTTRRPVSRRATPSGRRRSITPASSSPGRCWRRSPSTKRASCVDEDAAMKVDIVKIRVDDNLGTTPKMAPEIYRAVIDQAHKKGCASRRTSSTSTTPRRCSTRAPTSSRTASATPTSTMRSSRC